MPKRPHLYVIHGTPAPDTPKERGRRRARSQPKPAQVLSCPRCSGIEMIETKIGVIRRNGKSTGGTKVHVCACCLGRGERIVCD